MTDTLAPGWSRAPHTQETDAMTIENFPKTASADRMKKLRALLRDTSTAGMETQAVAEQCEREVPGCTVPEIIAALRQTAGEHLAEAATIEGKGEGKVPADNS
jgi:hypothetical protein